MRTVICICTCRRPALLDRLLGVLSGIALGDLDPANLCVVVVDNAPGGEAKAVCERWAGALPFALHYREEPAKGISFARNRAVCTALELGAAFVAFIDDDDLPKPDWVLQLVRKQRETGADVVFGFWQWPAGAVFPAWMQDVPFFYPPQFERRTPFGFPNWAGTYNVLIGRSVLEALGDGGTVFDPEYALLGGEDIDLFVRVVKLGFATVASADSVIVRNWEADRLTLRGVLRRAYRDGIIRVTIDRRHLTPERFLAIRRQRRRLWRSLMWRACAAPYAWLRGRKAVAVRSLVDLERWFGEIATEMGLGSRYYR